MLRISEQAISESPHNSGIISGGIIAYYDWKIIILNRQLAEKYVGYIGSNNLNIESISFEIGERGGLNASMVVYYFPVMLEINDIITIYHKEVAIYIGYISVLPKYTGGTVKIDSILNKVNEVTYRGTINYQTSKEILETVINATNIYTNILWNNALVDLVETDEYNVSYYDDTVKNIISDWAEKEDDRFWGINGTGYFFVKRRDTAVTDTIYSQEVQAIGYNNDYTKIKYTRIRLYRKISGIETYVAEIPDGSIYNYFDIEDIIGIRLKKMVAPDTLSEDESKLWAYGEVLAQIGETEQVNITGININDHKLTVGQRVRVFDKNDIYPDNSLVDTESIDNWTNATLTTAQLYYGTYAISINTGLTAQYTLESLAIYQQLDKIILNVYAATYGSVGTLYALLGTNEDNTRVTVEDDTRVTVEGDTRTTLNHEWINLGDIILTNPSIYNYCQFSLSGYDRIRALRIVTTQNIIIDYVNIIGYTSKYYEMNVESIKINLTKDNQIYYDVTLGAYDNNSNNIQFELAKEIERRS